MKPKTISIILIISLVILIVSLSYHLTAFRSSLYPLEQQQNIRDYLVGFDELTTEMSVAEANHLHDVKRVMQGTFIFSFFVLLVVISCTAYLRKNKELLLKNYKKAGIATIITIISLGIIGALSFNLLFTLFHKVFFPQGNWIFATDSVLITLFPQSFFIARFVEIVIVSVVLASIFIGVSVYLKRKNG